MERGLRYSRKGEDMVSGRTRWLGLNLRAWVYVRLCLWSLESLCTSAFGVDSVWMNIVRLEIVAATGAAFCAHFCTLGRCCAGEAVMGVAFWCRHLVATRGVVVRREGAVRVRVRMARGTAAEDMVKYEIIYESEQWWRCRNGGGQSMNESSMFRKYDVFRINQPRFVSVPSTTANHWRPSSYLKHRYACQKCLEASKVANMKTEALL